MSEQTIPEAKTPTVTPEMYSRVFVQNPEGALVLEDLLSRFHDRRIWASGGVEGGRETERRAAQMEVLRFILGRVGQLPESPEDEDNE